MSRSGPVPESAGPSGRSLTPTAATSRREAWLPAATVASTRSTPEHMATVVMVSTSTAPRPRPWCASTTSSATSAVSGAVRANRAIPAGAPSTDASQATWWCPSRAVNAVSIEGVSRATPVR
jgi:hypothetical protein